MVMYGSANRDERQFEDADVFDINRRPTDHLGFGHGKHYCIGAGLGRMLTRILTEELLKRVPEYQQAIEELDWLPSPTFGGVVTFPIRFRAG